MSWDWGKLINEILGHSFEGIVVAIAAGIVTWIVRFSWPRIRRWKRGHEALQNEIDALHARIQRALNAVGKVPHNGYQKEGPGLWLLSPITHPSNYFMFQHGKCVPIWVFANLKGGVAKTTNAVNLAAHYAARGERVLLIDLDYQASASSMGLEDNIRKRGDRDSRATRLIDGDYKPHDLNDENWAPTVFKQGMQKSENFRLIPAGYDLARAENRLMVEWLLDEREDDIRYTMARLLHDPQTQCLFDRIIIDAPPRLTTACVQALCAGTHVIIPTVLDQLSVEAVQTFIDQVNLLKEANICPNLQIAAILGYKSGQATSHIPDAEELIFKTLRDAKLKEGLYRSDKMIPHNPTIADSAGVLVAYLRTSEPQKTATVRQIYAEVAKSIEEQIANHAS